jgi:hypothetical protein
MTVAMLVRGETPKGRDGAYSPRRMEGEFRKV